MSKSLLEQLPGVVAAGNRQTVQILEQLEGRNRVTLQTREMVTPFKDNGSLDLFRQAHDEVAGGDVAELLGYMPPRRTDTPRQGSLL